MEYLEEWLKCQREMITKLEQLLTKQAEDHANYAHESSERMRELNKMMTNYIEIQHTHISEYVKHIDTAVAARDLALKNEHEAFAALREEQQMNKMLAELLMREHNIPSASINVGKIEPK